jgi:hypothetical protein
MTKIARLPSFPLALLAILSIGLVLGAAFPKQVEAANLWEFWHDVPVGSSSGQDVYLTCGWHGDCDESPTSGSGLDWGDTDDEAYLAGAAKWNGSGSVLAVRVVATNEFGYINPDCSYVVADIKNWYTGDVWATEIYTHVERGGGTFNHAIWASSGGNGFRVDIGDVVDDEDEDCPWDDPHVHQYGEDYDSTNTGGFPDYTECYEYDDYYCENPRTNQQWVHYENWTY